MRFNFYRLRDEITKAQQRNLAQAALAGWRFVQRQSSYDPGYQVWDTWAPGGQYHGTNETIYCAALYAIQIMKEDELPWQ